MINIDTVKSIKWFIICHYSVWLYTKCLEVPKISYFVPKREYCASIFIQLKFCTLADFPVKLFCNIPISRPLCFENSQYPAHVYDLKQASKMIFRRICWKFPLKSTSFHINFEAHHLTPQTWRSTSFGCDLYGLLEACCDCPCFSDCFSRQYPVMRQQSIYDQS